MVEKVNQVSKLIKERLEKLRIGSQSIGHKQHFFLCTGDSCSAPGEGEKSWEHLKAKLSEKSLTPGQVFRTKVGCLRVCAGGPIGLVYPEGTWYRGLSAEAIDRVIEEHLIGGRPVCELALATHPLKGLDDQS
jgi:(2Fe-2S) ferredoxin